MKRENFGHDGVDNNCSSSSCSDSGVDVGNLADSSHACGRADDDCAGDGGGDDEPSDDCGEVADHSIFF